MSRYAGSAREGEAGGTGDPATGQVPGQLEVVRSLRERVPLAERADYSQDRRAWMSSSRGRGVAPTTHPTRIRFGIRPAFRKLRILPFPTRGKLAKWSDLRRLGSR